MRLRILGCGLGVLLALAPAASAQQPTLETEDDKTLYALGLVLSQKIAQFQLDGPELAIVQAGFQDGASGTEPRVALEVYGPNIETMLRGKLQAAMDRQQEAGAAYYEKFASEPGVEKTATGLLFEETQAGTGPMPGPTDTVKVHYHGTLVDGTVFDSSRERATPATFALDGVIACFREGLQKLGVGGKAKLVCPSDLAYGAQGSPPRIMPGATLTFEVELIEIVTPEPEAPATP